jgi:hypothetical protein
MTKRFTEKFKRSKSHLANNLLLRVIDQQWRGKNFTIFMVQNWMYGRTPNEILDKEFEKMLLEARTEDMQDAFEEDLVTA